MTAVDFFLLASMIYGSRSISEFPAAILGLVCLVFAILAMILRGIA